MAEREEPVRKAVLFTLVLLISAVGLQTLAIGQSNDKSSTPTTLQGCLAFSEGHYWLTDSGGKKYHLSGEANRLTHYVGHQVEITGMPSVRTHDATGQGEESNVREVAVFRVKTVKDVASSCSASQ